MSGDGGQIGAEVPREFLGLTEQGREGVPQRAPPRRQRHTRPAAPSAAGRRAENWGPGPPGKEKPGHFSSLSEGFVPDFRRRPPQPQEPRRPKPPRGPARSRSTTVAGRSRAASPRSGSTRNRRTGTSPAPP